MVRVMTELYTGSCEFRVGFLVSRGNVFLGMFS